MAPSAEREYQAPVAQRVLDTAKSGDRFVNGRHRFLENHDPVESGKAVSRRGINLAPAGAGETRQPIRIDRESRLFAAETGAHRRFALFLQVDVGAHDPFPGVARGRFGDQRAASRGNLHAAPWNGLGSPVRDFLNGLDREHRLHDAEWLRAGRMVDADRDVHGPNPGRIVVFDLSDGNTLAPGPLPPAFVGLDKIAGRVGERDIEPVPVGEEYLREIRRPRNLLAQERIGFRPESETLLDVETVLHLVRGSFRKSRGHVLRVRRPGRLDHGLRRCPGLGLGDAADEESVDLARGIGRPRHEVGPGDIVGHRIPAPRETRLDDVEMIGEKEESQRAGEQNGQRDASSSALDTSCVRKLLVRSPRGGHRNVPRGRACRGVYPWLVLAEDVSWERELRTRLATIGSR